MNTAISHLAIERDGMRRAEQAVSTALASPSVGTRMEALIQALPDDCASKEAFISVLIARLAISSR